MSKRIKRLVVDTTAFIKASNLQDLAEEVYTIQEVIDEITNDRQKKRLVVLPYDLKVKNVFSENIKFVSDFSKKTGDYGSLSATDIKVIALTYQIEKEYVGSEHLKSEPTMQKTIKLTGIPKLNQTDDEKTATATDSNTSATAEDQKHSETHECYKEDNISIEPNLEEHSEGNEDEIIEQIKNMDLKEEDVEQMMVKVSDDVDEGSDNDDDSDNESESEDNDSDEGEWITPKNIANKKREADIGVFEEKYVEVACVTSDFAMQNVLKQIGLNVTSIDGRIIRQLRTFIFRCTTCFKTTSVMTKLFCPKCGHATLKKVAVSIDDDGNQHIHINGRKPLTARGKRFSLPTPKGGQHFQYPILTEDQHIHKRFASKIARNKTNALDPDYVAGFSPFVMKDVNSKSAVLGVRADKQDVKYWMKHYSKGKK